MSMVMSTVLKSLGLFAGLAVTLSGLAQALPVTTSASMQGAASSQWVANHADSETPQQQHKWRHHHRHGCKVMKQLNLTPEQKSQLKAKREAFRAQMQASGKHWKDLSKEERLAKRQQMKREFMAVLTPEQAKQFEALKSQCGRSKGKEGKPPEDRK